jgi:MGT family glycosyltransferase
MMSKILAYTSPARGHLFPLTPIIVELASRGHDVALRTLGDEVPRMRELGFDASAIDPKIEQIELDDHQAKGSRGALLKAAKVFSRRAEIEVPDIQAAIAAEQPDALIVDFNCWGAMAAAEQWGGPWAAFCPYPTMLRSPEAPPFGPGFAPARGALGRLRDKLAAPLVIGTVEKAFLPGVNAVRGGLGLGEFKHADDLVLAAPLMLYMTAEPFEYSRSHWPESFVMVGPCAWEPESARPPWLNEIDRPVVLVTTSSEFQDDGKLIEAAFEALVDQPFEVVATAPALEGSRVSVPANARVEQFVPHGQLLDKAVCAITHGGMGATQKALAHGVPVCAVPFGRDQREVARRVEISGAGTRLDSNKLSAARLRESVAAAIELADGAKRISEAFAATGGAKTAANAVEDRLIARARQAA